MTWRSAPAAPRRSSLATWIPVLALAGAAGVVFAIAESPKEKGVVWAGTNDGQVQVTRDAGGRWTNVTANMPGLPPWGTVSNIEPSRFDNGVAYVTVDLQGFRSGSLNEALGSPPRAISN